MLEKILQAGLPSGFDILEAARVLGIPTPGRTLVFEGETDVNALTDFFLHEHRVQGQTLLQCLKPASLGLTPFEAEHFAACRSARTSLFQVVEEPAGCQVRLRDLLEPEQAEVQLTDLNLSESLRALRLQPLLFLRVLQCAGLEMSTGFFFVFDADLQARLLQSFRQKMKKVAAESWTARKFIFFFEKNRDWGEGSEYADVLPSSRRR